MNEFGVEEKKAFEAVMRNPQVAVDYGYVYLESKRGDIFVFPKNDLVVHIVPQTYLVEKDIFRSFSKNLFGRKKKFSEKVQYEITISDAYFVIHCQDFYGKIYFSDLSESQIKSFAKELGIDIQGFIDRYLEPRKYIADSLEECEVYDVICKKWNLEKLEVSCTTLYQQTNGEKFVMSDRFSKK